MKNIHLVLTFMILAVLFIIIGHIYQEQIQSKLSTPLINLPSTSIDFWSISHMFLFFLFGLVSPNCHIEFLSIGITFEIIEDILSSDMSTKLVNCSKRSIKNHNIIGTIFCNGIQDDYWYSKWDDIFMNLLGYTIGSSLSTQFRK